MHRCIMNQSLLHKTFVKTINGLNEGQTLLRCNIEPSKSEIKFLRRNLPEFFVSEIKFWFSSFLRCLNSSEIENLPKSCKYVFKGPKKCEKKGPLSDDENVD